MGRGFGFWSNEMGHEIHRLTKEEFQVLEEYVGSMSGDAFDFYKIDYKKDFILTEERKKIINNLQKLVADYSEEWAYQIRKLKANGEYNCRTYDDDDSITYNTDNFFEKNGEYFIEIYFSCDSYNVEEEEEEEEDY